LISDEHIYPDKLSTQLLTVAHFLRANAAGCDALLPPLLCSPAVAAQDAATAAQSAKSCPRSLTAQFLDWIAQAHGQTELAAVKHTAVAGRAHMLACLLAHRAFSDSGSLARIPTCRLLVAVLPH